MYTIYTDGACKNNQGNSAIGGWGFVALGNSGEQELKYYGGSKNTTNNRMEMQALIEALKFVKEESIEVKVIFSDSAYVVNGINSWMENWKKRNWKNSKKQEVKNKDLWLEIDLLLQSTPGIEVKKIKGHAGFYGNEIADDLANKGAIEIMEVSK